MMTTEQALIDLRHGADGWVDWSTNQGRPEWSSNDPVLILDGTFSLEALEALVFLRKEELKVQGMTCVYEGCPHTKTSHAHRYPVVIFPIRQAVDEEEGVTWLDR